jgi:hypothetical protein
MRFMDIGRAALYSHIVVYNEILSEASRRVPPFEGVLTWNAVGLTPGGDGAAEERSAAR